MKTPTLILALSLAAQCPAQVAMPVQDKANRGQLKRMAMQQWDDWQPTPETGFLGLPKDPRGWFFWRVLHRDYYRGEDSRPYRADGTFVRNYASLIAQERDDRAIRDSLQAVALASAATYTSMSGGAGDITYTLYFQKQFDELFTEVPRRMAELQRTQPLAAAKMKENTYYRKYLEFADISRDRVGIIHGSFVDRGERMLAYLELAKELRRQNDVIISMIAAMRRLTALPPTLPKGSKGTTGIHRSDGEIVHHILSTHKF
jgi:hypothetical protein